MKHILLLLLAAVTFTAASAQLKDITSPPEVVLQLGNTSNIYAGVFTGTTATVNRNKAGTGLLLDTTSGVTAIYLQTVRYLFPGDQQGPITSYDTLRPLPLPGAGDLSFFARVFKVTGTDTITVTPVESLDGLQWYPVPGLSAVTVYPTSLTVGVDIDWTVNTGYWPIKKAARHYALKYVGNATTTISVQGWIRQYERK